MTFTERLRAVQHKKQSLLCVGLDVDLTKLPAGIPRSARGAFSFLSAIVESTYDLVCAYKPNLAFFEALGPEGLDILERLVSFIPQNIITIGDGKRGDIGNTADHYAYSLFDRLHFDAVTVNPYMGRDSVTPFLRTGRGVFLLALTSNPGSSDFQTRRIGKTPLYEKVVTVSRGWDTGGSLGYVVGATHPSQLRTVRSLAPTAPFLIPGVGSQGGDLRAAVRFGCTRSGDLAVINASRSVLYASSGRNFARVSRAEAVALRAAIEQERAAASARPRRRSSRT